MKKNEGITLIALIITIIILIILTAITINNVIGTDLIGFATKAAENYIDAEKEEEREISELISKADTTEKKLSGLITEKSYGDYINYPVDLGIGEEGYNDDWKIFYNDGTNVFIIASDYVKNTEEHLAPSLEAAGMTKAYTYNAYWRSQIDFTSIDESILNSFKAPSTTFALIEDYKNSQDVTSLFVKKNWESFINDKYADYAIGGPTLEMWCDSWNKNLHNRPNSNFKEIIAGGTNWCGYYVSSGNNKNKTYLYMNGTSSSLSSELNSKLEKDYSLYFPHASIVSNCEGYWLASPAAYTNNYLSIMVVQYDGGVGDDGHNGSDLGFRPLVRLRSDLSVSYDESQGLWMLNN